MDKFSNLSNRMLRRMSQTLIQRKQFLDRLRKETFSFQWKAKKTRERKFEEEEGNCWGRSIR